MLSSVRADLALLGLAVVGVAAELACILTGHPSPALFDQVVIAGIAGGAGVAVQNAGSAPTATAPAPAPAPLAPAPVSASTPAQQAAYAPPQQVPQQAAAVQPYTGPVGQ